MNKLGLTPEQAREFKLHSAALYSLYLADAQDLLPDVLIAQTASHRIVLNSKGEIEVVSSMGEIRNLGKKVK